MAAAFLAIAMQHGAALSPALGTLECRGDTQATFERPEPRSLIWRLAGPVRDPGAELLAANHCRWDKARPPHYAQQEFSVLFVCCYAFFENKLVAKARSGTPFLLYGHGLLSQGAPRDYFDVRGISE